MITLLTFLTALAALLFLAVVAVALARIVRLLEEIGGTGTSYLAKLRLGLRAIERETSHLPAAAVPVNEGLGEIAGGLVAVDEALGALHAALEKQEAA
ncbi:hypothetical protein [Aquicoccus porphyridii]|uniref:hypothetical protein n=1 Tax=Aquicoccus porphyridii TaxID=1852029 RepID=UPI00273F491D|nr:hypothetical protein [Aquicoccus porphyridii]